MIDIFKESRINYKKLKTGIALTITTTKGKQNQCNLNISEEAFRVLTQSHARVLFDADTQTMVLRPAIQGEGYKIGKESPHVRFPLHESMEGELRQKANVKIKTTQHEVSFQWPFRKQAQNITKLQPQEEKTMQQVAARTVTPQKEAQALRNDSTQDDKPLTQNQILEVLKAAQKPMTSSEIADELKLSSTPKRMEVNKRLHRLHTRKKVLVNSNQWARNSYEINTSYTESAPKPAKPTGIYAPEPKAGQDKNEVILEIIQNSDHALTLDELTKQSPYNYGTCYNAINKLVQQRKIMMTNRKPVMVKAA